MKSVRAPIRIAVIGGRRGQSLAEATQGSEDKIRLAGICDLRDEVLARWRKFEGIKCYTRFEDVLSDDAIDAVCIATPVTQHAQQSIAALNAGKHVLSEVTAAFTLDECWKLVEAVERTRLTYMLAENCCYFREVMMVGEMVRKGVFGDLIVSEGHYLHDCRDLMFLPDGGLTWRGELKANSLLNMYPTHSLGPVSQWLGINRTDRYVSTASWQSGSPAAADYVRRNLGPQHPLGTEKKWKGPDTVISLLRTEKGVLAHHRLDWSSPRPHGWNNRYSLQGTKAVFTSLLDTAPEPLIWMQDRSPTSKTGLADQWEPLYKYAADFEHPLWRKHGAEAQGAGHGGADFFVVREFADAMLEQRPPAIDVYDAVTWSSVTPLSAQSLASNNASVPVPDFRRQGRKG